MRLLGKYFWPCVARRVLAAVFFAAVLAARADDSSADYANWVKPWQERPATSPALAGAGLKLVVSRVQNEVEVAAVTAMTPVQRAQLAYHIQVSAAEVATNGSWRTYFVSNTDARSGPVRELAADDCQALAGLLEQLPDDHAQLPPAGDRLVVQTLADNAWLVRVYNGKNLPPEVKKLMSLLARPANNLF
jgi:hypothetical protein